MKECARERERTGRMSDYVLCVCERQREGGRFRWWVCANTGNRCLFLLPHPQGRNSCPEITVPTLQKMVSIDSSAPKPTTFMTF